VAVDVAYVCLHVWSVCDCVVYWCMCIWLLCVYGMCRVCCGWCHVHVYGVYVLCVCCICVCAHVSGVWCTACEVSVCVLV
jgi:hypothetical protein